MENKKPYKPKNGITEKRTYGKKDFWKDGDTDTRKFENPLKPLMSEAEKENRYWS